MRRPDASMSLLTDLQEGALEPEYRAGSAAAPSRLRFAAAIAVCSGSSRSTGRGIPVLTLQKAQARVQVSPRIITVACFLVQHSPMFGHAASSHTVCRLSSRISLRVSA